MVLQRPDMRASLAERDIANDVLARIAEGLGVPRGWMGLAYDTSAGRAGVGIQLVEDLKVRPAGPPCCPTIPLNSSPSVTAIEVDNSTEWEGDHLGAALAELIDIEYNNLGGTLLATLGDAAFFASLLAAPRKEVRYPLTDAFVHEVARWASMPVVTASRNQMS